MQTLLHTDPHFDAGHAMAQHLETVVNDALLRFRAQVTRVEAHLSDAHGTGQAHAGDIHCTLEAHLIGCDAVVVKDQAATAHQAIQGAVTKLKRALTTAIEKRTSWRGATPLGTVEPD
jgi:ribosome-associated translation inhibitor RaiA